MVPAIPVAFLAAGRNSHTGGRGSNGARLSQPNQELLLKGSGTKTE